MLHTIVQYASGIVQQATHEISITLSECKGYFRPNLPWMRSSFSPDLMMEIFAFGEPTLLSVKESRLHASGQSLEYSDTLKKRYGHMPEIKRIQRHRHVPKQVKKAGEIKGEELAAIKRRIENERKHSKKGQVPRRSEREKMILATEE